MYGQLKDMDTPTPTGKVWDNHLFALTDCDRGHGHDEIMGNINKGDSYFCATGQEFICVEAWKVKDNWLHRDMEHRPEVGQNWYVTLGYLKKDGGFHKGIKPRCYEWDMFSYELKGGL
jgi:hypothetical protein